MTRTLPNAPLWPRLSRAGRRADAIASSRSSAPSTGRAAASAAAGRPAESLDAAEAQPSVGTGHGSRRRRRAPILGRDRRLVERRVRLVERPEPLHPGEQPPLAVVEPLLDVEREDVPPARRPDAERDRDGVVGFVGDRHGDPVHPELLGARRRPAVEPDRRLAGRQPLDLDVAPADPADAEPEDLGHRLLRRPATGERLGPHPDVALLVRRQDPLARTARRTARSTPGSGRP